MSLTGKSRVKGKVQGTMVAKVYLTVYPFLFDAGRTGKDLDSEKSNETNVADGRWIVHTPMGTLRSMGIC